MRMRGGGSEERANRGNESERDGLRELVPHVSFKEGGMGSVRD